MRLTHLKPATGPVAEVGVAAVSGGAPHAFAVHLPERRLEVLFEMTADGMGWLVLEGRRYHFQVSRSGPLLEVWVDGRVRTFEVLERAARRSQAEQAGASEVLSAPMPGTVLKVEIAEGQPFEAHQPLVIMESMKMEMTLSVPHAGVVRQIQCVPGQLVDRGEELVLLGEPDESSGPAQ